MAPVGVGFADKLQAPTRVWSIGPLAKGETVMGFAVGPGGPTFTGPHVDSQTGSVFSATRSVVFAGNRLVLALSKGRRNSEGGQFPERIYELLSLDTQTGEVKETREIAAFRPVHLFATNDSHVIVAGRTVLRVTPDLNDSGAFDYHARGQQTGKIENMSPDGSTLGNATSPGFELVDARTLTATGLTASPSVATSVSSKGFLTDNVYWYGKYPSDHSFVTYVDTAGDHLIYHGKCGGRPEFLTDDLVLVPGCKSPLFIDTKGNMVRSLSVKGDFSFAGVSQNGKRVALQVATYNGVHLLNRERFVVYSIETGEPIAEVKPDKLAEGQSWTAFSPDGSMFVVGSPLKLSLYRLP